MTDAEQDLGPLATVECALLPLSDRRLQLLVPLNAIAEVVETLPPLVTGATQPNWLYGWLPWRQRDIPVLNYGAIGSDGPGDPPRRMVVVKALRSASTDSSFYGLATHGLPKPLRLGPDSELRTRDIAPPKGAAMLVEIGDE